MPDRTESSSSAAPASLTKSTSSWLAAGFSAHRGAASHELRPAELLSPSPATPSRLWLGSPTGERPHAVTVSDAGPVQPVRPVDPEDLLASWRQEWLDAESSPNLSRPLVLREIEYPHVSPRPALPRAMTSSLLDGSAPERCATRRANSDTPPPPLKSPSSIPEWRREGLGQEMLEALERIERDSPQPHEPTRKPRNFGSRLFGGGSRARASSGAIKDRRKAEKRREKEGAEPEACSEISTISAPFEVTHSVYLQQPGPASAACGRSAPG